MAFIPFDASESEIAELTVLRTEVSSGLQNEFINWILHRTENGTSWVNAPIYAEIASALDVGWSTPGSIMSKQNARQLLLALPGRKLLHTVDYMLANGYTPGPIPAALERARSAYMVREDEGRKHRLTTRVPEAVLVAARGLTSPGDAVGRLLTQA